VCEVVEGCGILTKSLLSAHCLEVTDVMDFGVLYNVSLNFNFIWKHIRVLIVLTGPTSFWYQVHHTIGIRIMPGSNRRNQYPREDGMLLYRGLVKDEINSSRYQVRKQTHSSEREYMRVLEILKLLPDTRANGMNKQIVKKTSKPPRRKVSIKTSSVVNSLLSPSPYNCNPKSRTTRPSRSIISQSINEKSNERKSSKRLLPRDDEYTWHPVTVQTGHKKEVIQDVMKHYWSQSHRHGRKKPKDG